MKASLTAVPFAEACKLWLETRKPYLAESTYRDYSIYIKTLSNAFEAQRLPEIDGEQIRLYQRMRMASVGPSQINKECSVLQQMLKRSGLWNDFAHDYQPLPLPKGERGRALSDAEYMRLFRAAKSNPNWEAACIFAIISVNTSAGPKEVRTIRLRDVDLQQRTVYIHAGGAKNEYRIRAIPLNDEAFEAVQRGLARAAELGSIAPDDYLFPFSISRKHYDPARCQTTFKKAWREMCAAADLHGFRMYDLRHTAITFLLENPQVSEETAEAIAGHISHRMKHRYAHIRMEYKRKAVEALRGPWKKRA